jgi:cation:H+ antiporter
VQLAESFGVPATVIGLFVVALGTSMPELATSIIAAIKHESDLALGNVVGSNLFNTLVVLPVSGIVRPIDVPAGGLLDLGVSWILVAILIPVFFLGEARLRRSTGGLLLAGYAGYAFIRIAGTWT